MANAHEMLVNRNNSKEVCVCFEMKDHLQVKTSQLNAYRTNYCYKLSSLTISKVAHVGPTHIGRALRTDMSIIYPSLPTFLRVNAEPNSQVAIRHIDLAEILYSTTLLTHSGVFF